MRKTYIPIALIGLPLLLVGFLTAYMVINEFESLDRKERAILNTFLKTVEKNLKTALIVEINTTLKTVKSAVKKSSRERSSDRPRNLILTQQVEFIVAYENGERTFPPLDSFEVHITERNILDKLKSTIINSQLMIERELNYHSWVRLSASETESLFHCEKADSRTDICILLSPEVLHRVVTSVFAEVNSKQPLWALSLVNLSDEGIDSIHSPINQAAPQHEQRLSQPLDNWILKVALPKNSTFMSRDIYLAALVILPLLISWVALSFGYYRSEKARVETISKRSDILAQLSHDLHTPLANLALYVDLVKSRLSEREVVNKYLATMNQEIERLIRLSRNTLSTSKADETSYLTKTINPNSVINNLLSRYSVLFKSLGCSVIYDNKPTPGILINPIALESILLQLLDNACKYGGEGIVSISTELTNDYLHILVQDYGPGIPSDLQEKVFEPHYRVDDKIKNSFGLGLASVRSLARLHGGNVTIKNTQTGTCFVVHLKRKDQQ